LHGDGAVGDGLFGAQIPPLADKTIVEFFVRATDEKGTSATLPSTAPAHNYLFQVDSEDAPTTIPFHRIVMTHADRQELDSRDVLSDVLLPATFIGNDQVFYDVGIRFRGSSARTFGDRRSFRIQFSSIERFDGIRKLNLNAINFERQVVALNLFRDLGIISPDSKFAGLVLNGDNMGAFNQVEAVDEDFALRHYPGDSGGNLYQGVNQGRLDYRGEDPAAYAGSYIVESGAGDLQDIIELSRAFALSPDDRFTSDIGKLIDIAQWHRFFAIGAILNVEEGGIFTDKGEDYYLYHRPSTGKFELIPWDFDSAVVSANNSMFRPSVEAIQRVLKHPDLAPLYVEQVRQLMNGAASEDSLIARFDAVGSLISSDMHALTNNIIHERFADLREQFPDKLTLKNQTSLETTLIPTESKWHFFLGTGEPPADWREPGFDDSKWLETQGGFGNHSRNLGTYVPFTGFPFGDFTTLYLRQKFMLAPETPTDDLRIRLNFTSGYIIYLNGTEVLRHRLGSPGEDTPHDVAGTEARVIQRYETFDLSPYASLLQEGDNVVAIQSAIGAPNLPRFVLDAGILASGPKPGRIFASPNRTILLGGQTRIPETRSVLLNDEPTTFVCWKAAWEKRVTLADGWNTFTAAALDELGRAIETTTERFFYSQNQTLVGGELAADTVWGAKDGPYRVTSSLIVPAGQTLRIEPGAIVMIDGN
ncbi:MAG: CotH kinase family protein, partial [bacterium]